MTTQEKLRTPWARLSGYVWLGLLGQLLWGCYPPAAKRALMEVPKFSLLFLATIASTLVGLAVMWREERRSPRAVWRLLWKEGALWGLVFFVVLRSVTNLYAIDLTRATWVQLVYLLTPFAVAILGALFFGEPTPRYTYEALLLSSLGASLVLVKDWSDILAGFTIRDFIGLGVAGLSMLSLAVYFLLVRRSSQQNTGRGMIMFQQGLALVTTYGLLSLLTGEDWHTWTRVSPQGWAVVLWLILGVFVVGNLLQITALGGANAALVTSLMPLRLVSAIALGWWLLGERLTTPLQWLGAGLVLVTVSGYLWLQGSGNSTA
ncbi:MAG: DMT family transporter [Chloroflexi bacterium]|nr:DMT family transporter [Chloroflexota bacterium]